MGSHLLARTGSFPRAMDTRPQILARSWPYRQRLWRQESVLLLRTDGWPIGIDQLLLNVCGLKNVARRAGKRLASCVSAKTPAATRRNGVSEGGWKFVSFACSQ